ncbi:MAG TPA: ABC transporter ATP-binding protein [Vicinamibacterales bacterium]|jgi:ABC-2 type transport system ATP-binding protein|nr:ABC transporter ATP-binding protein [Vicinamibacterales bacterium]
MLEAVHLTKYYGALPAIRDVSFVLQPGRIVGLLGRNGSGKSTTVKIVTGLIQPSSGKVQLDGASIDTDPIAYKAQVGYVPEEAHLYQYLTGPEYLSLVGRLRGLPAGRLDEKIEAFLTLWGIEDARYAPISAYSKGMRQKVLLSAALLHDPRVVVFDEPNSGLDVTASLVLRSLVNALAREGKLILYSSHLLETVEAVCTNVVILHEGRVVAHDDVSQLRDLMKMPTLEEVFRALVIETDVDRTAEDLVGAMRI